MTGITFVRADAPHMARPEIAHNLGNHLGMASRWQTIARAFPKGDPEPRAHGLRIDALLGDFFSMLTLGFGEAVMKLVLTPIMAGVIVVGIGLGTVQTAEAGRAGAFVGGVAVGIIASELLHHHCHYGRRYCRRVRNCHYGRGRRYHCHRRYRCHRRRYCH